VSRPWLPGSYPMPEPYVWQTDESAPGVGVLTVAEARVGENIVGLPQNIVNSLLSCIEGENRLFASVTEYRASQTPTSVITALTPPDAVASGTAPISLQVTGSGFRDNSKVVFNGVMQPTMFYSDTKLVAEVTKIAIGYYPVVVKTGDKTSNMLQFRFR